jgi:shikimate 5-dehydrogenase
MQLFDKTVIVTGGGSGIGRALCDAFHQARAKRIVVADVDLKAAEHVAAKVGGVAAARFQDHYYFISTLVMRGPGRSEAEEMYPVVPPSHPLTVNSQPIELKQQCPGCTPDPLVPPDPNRLP